MHVVTTHRIRKEQETEEEKEEEEEEINFVGTAGTVSHSRRRIN